MVTYSAVGRPTEVRDYLDTFAKPPDAGELIIADESPTVAGRVRSATLVAEVMVSR